jgi:hypothetical protein
MTYQWFFNGTNPMMLSSSEPSLNLTNVQVSNIGFYSVVAWNSFGSITSSPAMLNVIAPVPRRVVPRIQLLGGIASQWQLETTESLDSPVLWRAIEPKNLTGVVNGYLDLTQPLPAQRFYRTRKTSSIPGVRAQLNMYQVPALTLSGSPGEKIRVDAIKQYGPTDTWFTLATVTLTNSLQLYFDVSAPGQPQRLYRLVPVP